MQSIKITIDLDPQKIPDLVCTDHSLLSDDITEQIAIATAKALGIEDYLSQPDRIYELRRWMWERDNSSFAFDAYSPEEVALEMPAD
ncbi:MAG: hypothetical protein OXI16_07835 [Chloroflexota bacterium]|nr:hypothetical protein [Chloroflexota bacterium]MYC06583.1 hypothetical protein [Chloroflexota bacterium]